MTQLKEEFSGLYSLPGEGFVAQIRYGAATRLYDRQGLQHLILHRKKIGVDIQALEKALARIDSLGDNLYIHNHNLE